MGNKNLSGRTSFARAIVVAAGLVCLSACDSGSPTSATPLPTPTPPPPPRTVLSSTAALPVDEGVGHYFVVDRVGTLDVTVAYTNITNQLWIYLATGQCSPELFSANQCTFPATSFAGPNPRTMRLTGAAAGTYTLIVLNAGPDVESVQYQVTLTPSATGSAGVSHRSAAGDAGRWTARLRD